MSVFDQTSSSRAGSRFGNLSTNMFFVRNTAKPKRVRHIEGLNGALICNVNDNPSLIRSNANSSLDFSRTNLPIFETQRRVERLVPPMGFWNTHGIIHDTERWKHELASLATASGLGIERDEQKYSRSTADQQHASRSGAHYSTRTGRFNEGNSKSRGRTGSKHATANPDVLFNVSENEREMWMLQVLCQILGTSNLEDIQSWLVSATPQDKEQARFMINAALRETRESNSTVNQTQQPVDLNSLSNFVERQKNEEKYASERFIKDSLNRSLPALQSIDEEQQSDINLNSTNNTNNDYLNMSLSNAAAYKRAYLNNKQQPNIISDKESANKMKYQNESNDIEEQIDTIKLDDDRQRSQSVLVKPKRSETRSIQSSTGRPTSSQKQQHSTETMEFNDENSEHEITLIDNDKRNERDKLNSSLNQAKTSTDESEQSKSRKIRELQSKLIRQEEESKKKFNELQLNQSRLENALKFLAKQSSPKKKSRSSEQEQNQDTDGPVVNLIIQSPRETNARNKSNEINPRSKNSDRSTVHVKEKSKKNLNKTNEIIKLEDNDGQDVKIQISLSRSDNHPSKVFSGVWKPDVSTIKRLQGN